MNNNNEKLKKIVESSGYKLIDICKSAGVAYSTLSQKCSSYLPCDLDFIKKIEKVILTLKKEAGK